MAESKTIKADPTSVDDAMRQEYVGVLMKVISQHGTTSEAVNERLRALMAVPNPSVKELRRVGGLLKTLCDCKILESMVNCLCEWLTRR